MQWREELTRYAAVGLRFVTIRLGFLVLLTVIVASLNILSAVIVGSLSILSTVHTVAITVVVVCSTALASIFLLGTCNVDTGVPTTLATERAIHLGYPSCCSICSCPAEV